MEQVNFRDFESLADLSGTLSVGSNFPIAAQTALRFLQTKIGFDLWMVTRTEGNDWIVLQAEDSAYGVQPGDSFCWTDSFCSRMVQGLGPRVVPDCQQVPLYQQSPIAQQYPIRAYFGVPLTYSGGQLFGTLCAIHPEPLPESIAEHLPLVELVAALLGHLLSAELALETAVRQRERSRLEAELDSLTGVYNRRGWERVLAAEEYRCRNYGSAACVVMVDVDDLKPVNDTRGHGAGDVLLQKTAEVLLASCRSGDCVARLGGDEFALLLVNCDSLGAEEVVARIGSALTLAGVNASIGCATRQRDLGLAAALAAADRAMYLQKQHRKGLLQSQDRSRGQSLAQG